MKYGIITCIRVKIRRIILNMSDSGRFAAFVVSGAMLLSAVSCGKKVSEADVAHTTETTAAVTETVTETLSAETSPTTSASTTVTTVVTTAPQPPENLVLSGKESVGVYEEITISDFITDKNVELAEPEKLLDVAEIGEHEIAVKYRSGGGEFEKKLSYKVVDTTKPVLLNAGWSPVHIRGKAFDLNNYVGFADNFDKNPVLTYTGTVDPNVNGDYPLKATVTDNSGNSVSWDVTITVADYIPSAPDTNTRVPFSDFMAKNSGENRCFGIDVSTWQGNVDFNAVKEAGAEFVFIRIGYYYDHVVMDDYFKANLKNAKDAGLKVGLYFYTTDNTEEGAREHARWITEQLGGTSLELPIAFDWEEFGNFQQYGMSIHDLNQIYLAFADEIEKQGYKSMLYSSKNFLNNFWSESTKAANPVWLAHFVDETDYTGDYWIWQGSCFGRIPGIAGDVDMNVMYNKEA